MSLRDILYLKEENFIANVIKTDGVEQIYSIKSELNQIAKKHFINISEYRKLVRKKIDLKNKIPIYFSNQLLLFNVKSNETVYWINYFNILKICKKDKIIIIFKNGTLLELEISKNNMVKELRKTKKVLDYIANL